MTLILFYVVVCIQYCNSIILVGMSVSARDLFSQFTLKAAHEQTSTLVMRAYIEYAI